MKRKYPKKKEIKIKLPSNKDYLSSPLLAPNLNPPIPLISGEKDPIYLGPTRFIIPCSQSGFLWNTNHSVIPLVASLREYKKDHFTDKMIVSNQHAIYDPTGFAIFPRYSLDHILLKMKSLYGVEHPTIIHLPDYPLQSHSIQLKDGVTPRDYQVEFIDYLSHPNNKFSLLELGCGEGKTFISTSAVIKLGLVPLIVTSGLVEQWTKEFLSKTDISRDDIYILQGRRSIEVLQDAEGYYPKVFVASTRTLAMYAGAHEAKKLKDPGNTYKHFMRFSEFVQKFGIGVKIIDEVHENFAANMTIDMSCDIPRNIYLSATYLRSDSISNRIFHMVYPEDMRYGSHRKKKHLTITTIGYSLNDRVNEGRCNTKDGYNHFKYEQQLLKNIDFKRLFFDAIVSTTIKEYYLTYRNPGQKCLIITGTTEMADELTSYIKRKYPELNIVSFYGSDQEIPEGIDVIVSTLRKSSTGRDIKGLKVLANTVSFAARNLAEQLPGRQRDIPGEELFYLDFFNVDLETHQRHVSMRSTKYKDICKKYCSKNL